MHRSPDTSLPAGAIEGLVAASASHWASIVKTIAIADPLCYRSAAELEKAASYPAQGFARSMRWFTIWSKLLDGECPSLFADGRARPGNVRPFRERIYGADWLICSFVSGDWRSRLGREESFRGSYAGAFPKLPQRMTAGSLAKWARVSCAIAGGGCAMSAYISGTPVEALLGVGAAAGRGRAGGARASRASMSAGAAR